MNITPEMITEDEKRWHARDVIKELGYCGNHMSDRKDMTNLDIRFYAYIMRKACDMLKAQMPRVMTFDELHVDADESVICYIEFRDKDEINVTAPFRYPGDNLIQIPYIGTDYRKWVELKQYGKTWRCWTSRPTEEQRKNTPWEPPKEEDDAEVH